MNASGQSLNNNSFEPCNCATAVPIESRSRYFTSQDVHDQELQAVSLTTLGRRGGYISKRIVCLRKTNKAAGADK